VIYTLAAGTLIADPIARTTGAGKPYVTALLRVPIEGEEAAIVSLAAFDEAVRAALAELCKGDALSVAGRGKLTAWTSKEGEQRHGLSVVAQRIITGGPPRRAKAAKQPRRYPEGGEGFPPGSDNLSILGGQP
jgi:single-stranded DNA-binding protein